MLASAEMATEVRGAGGEFGMPYLGSGFYSAEAVEFGGQKEGYGGANSPASGSLWLLLFGFYGLKINPAAMG